MSTIIIEYPTNNFSNPNPLFIYLFIFNVFKSTIIIENPTNNFSNPNPLFAYNNVFKSRNWYNNAPTNNCEIVFLRNM